MTDVAGAGDSIEETIRIMERGAQQGLRNADALKTYASFWDTVGDATGEAGDQLADAAVALEAFGISAENVTDAQGAFGYVLTNTTTSLSEFLNVCQRTAPDVENLGLSVDDMAVIVDSLEERGITGRKAITAISEAAKEADGDVDKFAKTLGLSREELERAEVKTKDYSRTLQDMAKAHEDNLTPIQKLTSAFGEMQYKAGESIKTISNIAPALMLLGPGIKTVDTLRTGLVGLAAASQAAGGMTALLSIQMTGLYAAMAPFLPLMVLFAAGLATIYLGEKFAEYQSKQMTEALERETDAQRDLREEMADTTVGIGKNTDAVLEAEEANTDLGTSAGDLETSINDLGGAYDENGQAVEILAKKTETAAASMKTSMTAALLDMRTVFEETLHSMSNQYLQFGENLTPVPPPPAEEGGDQDAGAGGGDSGGSDKIYYDDEGNYIGPDQGGDRSDIVAPPTGPTGDTTGTSGSYADSYTNAIIKRMGGLNAAGHRTFLGNVSPAKVIKQGNQWIWVTSSGANYPVTLAEGSNPVMPVFDFTWESGADTVPGLAGGGSVTSGGLAVVGENGPELRFMPRGASVVPLSSPQLNLGGGVRDVHLHIGTLVADDAGLRKLNRALLKINNLETVRTGGA